VSAGVVDLLHDPLCPLNARGNQLVRPWASLWPTEQIVGGLHVQTRKDRGHDPDHAFAPLVHRLRIILCSPCLRSRVILVFLVKIRKDFVRGNLLASKLRRPTVVLGPSRGGDMEFRLIYGGSLLGASRTDTRSKHKHDIRRVFRQQLKQLWRVSTNLREWVTEDSQGRMIKMSDALAARFRSNDISYVPISIKDFRLGCSLDILMLRPDQPGQTLMQSGDIDNRLKTVFDALRMPVSGEHGESDEDSKETPFFCLLEDDSLVNHLSVTTDLLLGVQDKNEVRLVITVKLWPMTGLISTFGIF
jgi:hypothetical protein